VIGSHAETLREPNVDWNVKCEPLGNTVEDSIIVDDIQQCDEVTSLLGGKVLLKRDFIVDNAYLKPGDAAIVGGSLIEGIGNINSDIDVYVITKRLRREREVDLHRHFRVFDTDRSILTGSNPNADVYLIHTIVPGERIKVDIEYRTWQEAEELSGLVNDLFQAACKSLISLTTVMERRSLAFIHRFHNSKIVCANTALMRLRDRMSVTKFKYLLYRWKSSDYSVLLDMQGAWEDRDWIRCADMSRENMVTQFHAYTHLCGNTNYHRKWIIPYSRRLNVEKLLFDKYLALLTSCAGKTEDELRSFILETIDFVDKIFIACRDLLEEEPLYPSGTIALSAIDTYFRSEAGDYSENEIAYCKKAYSAQTVPTRDWFRR